MYGRTDMECKQAKERYGLATVQGDVYIFWTFYIGKEFRQIIPNTAAAFTIINTAHMSFSTLCMKFSYMGHFRRIGLDQIKWTKVGQINIPHKRGL